VAAESTYTVILGVRASSSGMVDGRLDENGGEEIIRIVSARPAERRERKLYHEA
jgi:hypothetical protein